MPVRHEIGLLDEFPEGRGREIVVGGRVIAVFRMGENWFALDGICPHAGGPLGQGYVAAGRVTCPWHGWQFELGTGRHSISSGICQETYPVEVLNGAVYVDLPD